MKTISEINSLGLDVKKIIINSNLTETEAFAAETALINAFNYVSGAGLTNIVAGHHSAEAIKSITGEYVKGFEEGESIYFEGSDAKPKPKLTYTLQDPSFNKVFDEVRSWSIQLPSGVTEIEIYKVSDVTNRQLRFNHMREYLIDHIGECVFSRAKASRYKKEGKVSAIGTRALIQFLMLMVVQRILYWENAEGRNDDCKYATLATQEDFDRFVTVQPMTNHPADWSWKKE